MWRNTQESWGAVAKWLHWTMALLVITLFALGWLAELAPRSPGKINLFVWHKSLGMLALGLAAFRLVWQLANPTPNLPANTPTWERFAARASHALIYVLLFSMPISGWIINSAANVPFRVFWLFPLPHIAAPSQELREIAETVHLTLFWIFLATLLVHIGAAIRHHVIKHTNVLVRMLPGGTGEKV
jgi:cytochrome b561